MYEKSAGCIVYIQEKKRRLYLLLYKKASDHYKESWGFPKGWVEKGEEDRETAIRETKEESGLTDVQILPGFVEKIHIFYKKEGQMVSKDIIYFIAKTEQKDVKVSFEHSGYEWLPYKEAAERLTFKSDRETLQKADEYLKKELKNNLSKFLK
jgi:8-oxo-dGTP pyrophosphatase MutT (NUDIX family)